MNFPHKILGSHCWRFVRETHHSQKASNVAWWRHQMKTFSALLALCRRNSPVTGEFPTQRPVTRSFDVFFDLRLDKRLSKQSWGWWFETPSRPIWRHCNIHGITSSWVNVNRASTPNRPFSQTPQCTYHIPQYTIQNRNVPIYVLNGVLWDMGEVHCGICENGLFYMNEGYVPISGHARE